MSLRTRRAVHQLPPSTRPNSLDYGLQVHLQTRSITASKCISKLAQSWPPSVCPNSLDHGIQVPTIMASKCIYTLARSLPSSVSLNSLDYGLQVHLQSRSIMASKVHLQTRSITPPACIPEFTQSSFSGAPRIALKHRLQPVQIYRV
jgi:hypothetical protein